MTEIVQLFKEAFLNPNWFEVIAVLSALAYVFFASREQIICWFFGAVSTTIYIYLVFVAGLYLETILQSFYLVMAFVGWYQWKYGGKGQEKLKIRQLTQNEWFAFLVSGIILTVVFGFLFGYYFGNELPYVDAFTTVFAFIATWMVVKKILENWLFWIVIDFVSIGLYFSRELYISTFLYLLYTIIAIYGFFEWRRRLNKQQ